MIQYHKNIWGDHMSRIFLSHSSQDKHFVEPIADLLGRHNCAYDKYTFEIGMKTMEEILSNMVETDIFVYFISNASLESQWVKTELNMAHELTSVSKNRLAQIFPIIIDSTISHTDERIAPFLRENYILQRVDNNYKLAYRKIIQQISKKEYERNRLTSSSYDTFYGRDSEIIKFKQRIDDVMPIKTAIISGIPGIGKKSFIKHALIQAKVIKPYYSPIVLSMTKNGSIEDLILSISDAGFASYTLADIVSINDMNEKIDILTDLINRVQKYKEIIIIEDDETIVTLNGEIKYWFYNAIKNSKIGIGIVITSSVNVDRTRVRNYPEVFFENLIELTPNERLGLLRTYSDSLNLELTQADRLYFKDCLTGYPPQIIYCADLIRNEGIDYAKDNTAEISAMPEQISSTILEKCQQDVDKQNLEGILSVIAKMEIAPVKIINKICKLNLGYRTAVNILKQYSICYMVGANGEYIKMNSFIEDFVTRNRMQIPEDIQNVLSTELEEFNKNIDENEELTEWDTSELKYYIKTNIKNGNYRIGPFLYSTVILQTVSELYHETKYSRVIELVNTTKANDRYKYFDRSIVSSLQRFLCQALTKSHDRNFDAEVEYFAEEGLWIEYNFLKGFWYRCTGRYDKAEDYFNKVLENNSNHYATKRELVIVYLSLHDFDSAYTLAKSNYTRHKDNLFGVQAYFECLLEKNELDDLEEKQLQEMLVSLKRLYRVKPNPVYYQLLGKYEAYHEKNKEEGIICMDQGLDKFPDNMYLIRDKFDIYRRFGDIRGMTITLDQLSKAVEKLEYKGVLFIRHAILDLINGKPPAAVRIYLREEGIPTKAIDNILRKYSTQRC